MIRNEIRGVDVLNQLLWFARKVSDDPMDTTWEGTGLDIAGIVTHVDFKSAVSYYLMGYSKTDMIQGVLNGQYKIAIPSNAAATTLLDTIVKELGYGE